MSTSPNKILAALGLGASPSASTSTTKPLDLFAKLSNLKKKTPQRNHSSGQPTQHHHLKPKSKPKAADLQEVKQILSDILDNLDPPSKVSTQGATTSSNSGGFVAPDGKVFDNKRSLNKYLFRTYYTFQDKTEESLRKAPGSISGQPFELKSLKKCEVRLMCWSSQVNVDQVLESRVFVGPCETSVFIRDCIDCTFTIACKQLRLRDCSRCKFYLFSETDPIIETSSTLVFAPFNAAYKELEEQFKAAKLNPKDNHWRQIFDFNPSEEERLNYLLEESNVETWNISGNTQEAHCNPVSLDSNAVTVSDGGSRLPGAHPQPTDANVNVFDWATPADLEVGTRVRVNFNRESNKPLSSDFYAGKVVGINADGTYSIAYEDGDEEEKCNILYIKASKRKIEADKREPKEEPSVEENEEGSPLDKPSGGKVSDQDEVTSAESVTSETATEASQESLLAEEVEEVENTVKRLLHVQKKQEKKKATELRKLKSKLKKLKEEGEIERRRLGEDERRLSTLFKAFGPASGNQRSSSDDIRRLQRRIAKQLETNQATRARRRKMVAQFKDMLHKLESTDTKLCVAAPHARKDIRIFAIAKNLMNGLSMAYYTVRRGKVVEIPTLMTVITVEWEQYVANNPVHLVDFPSRSQDPKEWKEVGELLYTLGCCNPTLTEDFFKLWFDWSRSSGKKFFHVRVDADTSSLVGLPDDMSVIPTLTYANRSTTKFYTSSSRSTGSRVQTARKPLTPLQLAKNSIYRDLCYSQWRNFETVVSFDDSLLHHIQAGALSKLRQYAAVDTQIKGEQLKAMRKRRTDQADARYTKWKAAKEAASRQDHNQSDRKPQVPTKSASRTRAFECWEQRVEDEEDAAHLLKRITPEALCLGKVLAEPQLRILQDCPAGSHEAWLLVGRALKLLSPRLLQQWISWTNRSFEGNKMLTALPFKLNFYSKANGPVYFVPERRMKGWSKRMSGGTVLLIFANDNQTSTIPIASLCTPDVISSGSIAVVEPGQFTTEDQLFCRGTFQFELSNVAATSCTAYILPEIIYSLYPTLSDGSRSLTEAIRVHCTRDWKRLPTAFVRWFPGTKSYVEETTLLREALGIERSVNATKVFAMDRNNKSLVKLARRNEALSTDTIVFGCRPLLRRSETELLPLPVKPLQPIQSGKAITPYVRIGDRISVSVLPKQQQTWHEVICFDVIASAVQVKPCSAPASAKQLGLPSSSMSPSACSTSAVSKLPVFTLEGAFVYNERHGFYQLPTSGLLKTWAKHLLQQLVTIKA